MMHGARIALALFVLGVALGLAQLWLAPWSPDTFVRMMITVAALILVFLMLFYYAREGRQHDNIRKGGELDD